MFTISGNRNSYGLNIQGDFWEFDRLYYAIAKYIGEYGLDQHCSFPSHTATGQALLGLSYELRKAQRGEYELYIQYNGYPSSWFENPEELRKIDIDLAKIDYLEDLGLLDDYDEDINPDEIEDDDIEDALYDFDESTVESAPSDGLALTRYPEARNENTLLQLPMTYSEAIYYALIIEELLSLKEYFWKQKKESADQENPCWGMDQMYYYAEGHLDIDRLRFFRDEVFSAVYHKIKKEAFAAHLLPLLDGNRLVDDRNIGVWTGICEEFAKRESEAAKDTTAMVICEYLKELGENRVL